MPSDSDHGVATPVNSFPASPRAALAQEDELEHALAGELGLDEATTSAADLVKPSAPGDVASAPAAG